MDRSGPFNSGRYANGKHQVTVGQEPDLKKPQLAVLVSEAAESVPEAMELDSALPSDADLGTEDIAIDQEMRPVPVKFGGKKLPETLNALNIYLARLRDVKILPPEEQARLAVDFQESGNKDSAAKLVASNLRLVVKIAFQFKRQWADVMDLVSEGNVGLAEAIRKFDATKGIPFPSYARFWIRARILAFIQENKHLVHAGSRAARKLFWRLERERRNLVQEGLERVRQLELRIKQRLKGYLKKHLGEDVIVEALR
jgi:RNA polymerase sigma-32 factor